MDFNARSRMTLEDVSPKMVSPFELPLAKLADVLLKSSSVLFVAVPFQIVYSSELSETLLAGEFRRT